MVIFILFITFLYILEAQKA